MSAVAASASGVQAPAARPAARLAAPWATPVLALTIGAALAAIAFGADGGLRLGPTTLVEVLLLAVGGALAAAAILTAAPSRAWGVGSLALLAALAALTTLSVIWAVQPSDAWLEATRTLSYLATFAGAIALARLAPGRWAAALGGVAIAGAVVCGYALLTKVFPATLAPDETFGRLREPFGYWNAVGLMAALAMPVGLWLGARRDGATALRALACPLLGLLTVTTLLSYSRGALLAIAAGLAFWLWAVPLRLRSLAVLAASSAGAGALVAWAFTQDALTKDEVALVARTHAGHRLGWLLALMLVALLAAGWAIELVATRRPPSEATRRRIGRGLLAGLALAPVLALVALAFSSGGVGGQLSDGWRSITDANAITPANDPGRLTATSSVRARYWREAVKVFADDPWIGAGAGGYATARTRYRRDGTLEVRHAHGYVAQTMADLGIAGLVVSLALLAAWLAAAARATGLRRRDRGRPHDAERIGLLTLVTVVVMFGVHSLVDWTWFVPGTAVVALLCAGWVAARGPLGDAAPARLPVGGQGRAVRLVGAGAVVALTLVAAFASWQPLRSVNAGNEALAALAGGRPAAAAAAARTAANRNPLSVEPLFDRAVIAEARGRVAEARRALERAVSLQPSNADTWRRLAEYEIRVARDPRGALRALRAALYLDPRSPQAQADVLLARRQLAAP